jgi:NAD(P)H dehydrogenase (quinone)
VHDPEKAANVRETGVEIAEGDLEGPETPDAALEGVDRLFLLMGTAENQVELENDIIDAAVRTVGRVEPRSFEDHAREFAPAFA